MQVPQGDALLKAKQGLYPQYFVSTAIQQGGIPDSLVLIFGVLAVGSEYGWGTLKTLLTQRPSRIQALAVKLLALLVSVAVAALVYLLVAAAASVLFAAIDGHSLASWPNFTNVVGGYLALLLVWSFWALFGATLAILFRHSALAVGLGLAYMFAFEGLLLGLGASFGGDLLHNLEKAFPGPNAGSLAMAFGPAPPVRTIGSTSKALVGAEQATVVLLGYCLLSVLLAGLLFRRDVQ
jgi:ABC-type transport system involved in multi-copper enzyme maturation permease subunit